MLGKQTINQIGAEQISIMISTQQALKDGDTTVEELLKDIRERETVDEKKEKIKKSKGNSANPTLL